MRIFSISHWEMISIILDIHPEKGLVVYVVIMFYILKGTSILLSVAVESIYISTNSVQGSNIYTWYLFFVIVIQTGLRFIWFAFSWLRLNIFVYIFWTSYVFFGEMSVQVLCYCLTGLCWGGLLLSYCYILEVYIAYKYILLSHRSPINSVNGFFHCVQHFSLM